MSVLLLSDDLIFTSRVAGTARALGIDVRMGRSAEVLLNLARQKSAACAIIDLANPGLSLEELVAGLRAAGVQRIVGYGPHVDIAALKAARAAGCDPVLPRSKFIEELPRALSEWVRID